MLLNEMKIGRPLEIYINRDGYNYRVVSKIEDVGANYVSVTLIASKTRVFEFLETDAIEIVYRNEDRLWKWKNVKGIVVQLDGDDVHRFTSEEAGEPYNRRNAFRVYMGEKMIVQRKIRDNERLDLARNRDALISQTVINYDPRNEMLREECFRFEECDAFIRDISEVGVGMYCNEKFAVEDIITFSFTSEVGPINCESMVVRANESRHGLFQYYYGCRFTETSRTLTRYIYEMQRKQLQRSKDSLGSR